MLNIKPAIFEGRSASGFELPVKLDAGGISLEVLKRGEKDDSLVIRLVETQGRTSNGKLQVTGNQMIETDLLEWTEGNAIDCKESIPITLKPFEIRTYKCK